MCYSSMNCTIPLHIVRCTKEVITSCLIGCNSFLSKHIGFLSRITEKHLVWDAKLVLIMLNKHIECAFC